MIDVGMAWHSGTGAVVCTDCNQVIGTAPHPGAAVDTYLAHTEATPCEGPPPETAAAMAFDVLDQLRDAGWQP